MYSFDGDSWDVSRFDGLTGEERERAKRMLILELETCHDLAPRAIARLGARELAQALEDVLLPDNVSADRMGGAARVGALRVAALVALNDFEPSVDRSRFLLPLLSDASGDVRVTAAMHARSFKGAGIQAALIESVRHDRSYLVRYQAANSVLALANVYPREVQEHQEIFRDLLGAKGKERENLSLGSLFGWNAPPTPEDKAAFERAARGLEELVAGRAAQGNGTAPASGRPR
jgi:hypothetical protein